MQEISDQKLVRQYLNGDKESLEILIKHYLKPVYSFSYFYLKNRTDAEDATQEVFVKVWKNIRKFDQNKKFKTWIFAIAKNTSLDSIKKKKALLIDPAIAQENETPANLSSWPEEIFGQNETSRFVKSIIKQLPQKYQTVLLMRYYNSLNFREIAATLNESINTVKSWHFRAIKDLKVILAKIPA